MPIQVRKGSGAFEYAMVAAFNALRSALAPSGTFVHAEVSSSTGGDFTSPKVVPSTFTLPPASDLPSLLRLCTEIAGRLGLHFRDMYAHRASDGASALAKPAPTTLAEAMAFLNDAKAKWNAHLTRQGVHLANDIANAIGAPDAIDQQTAQDLANTIRVVFAAHIQNALPGAFVELTSA
jgi:hypothetical protein